MFKNIFINIVEKFKIKKIPDKPTEIPAPPKKDEYAIHMMPKPHIVNETIYDKFESLGFTCSTKWGTCSDSVVSIWNIGIYYENWEEKVEIAKKIIEDNPYTHLYESDLIGKFEKNVVAFEEEDHANF